MKGHFDPDQDDATPIFARFYPTEAACTDAAGKATSFRLLTPAYGLTRIGIRFQSKAAPPRALLLATRTKTYRLVFDHHPQNLGGKTVWFDLPAADRSGCFSLGLETVDAPSAKPSPAPAEVAVRTEAEDGRGLPGFARDLLDGKRRRQAALLLEQGGAASLAAITTVWPKLDGPGRLLALEAVTKIDPAQGAPLLAKVLMNGNQAEGEAARQGLVAAGPAALTALAAKAGTGNRKRRSRLRRHLSALAALDAERTRELGRLIHRADSREQTERLYDLVRAGAGRPQLALQIQEIATRRYPHATSFADRYRLLGLMSRLPCSGFESHLRAAATDPDRLIRVAAIAALGRCENPSGPEAAVLKKALNDPAPEVRLAALRSAAERAALSSLVPVLTELSGSDPWPAVRARVAAGAAELSPQEAVPILRIALGDSSLAVRKAALPSAVSAVSPEIDTLIVARLEDAAESPEIIALAADAAGKRCQKSALPALFAVLKKGAAPLAAPEAISAAVFAAGAMGAIGGKTAQSLLQKAARRSNPAIQRAIGTALATLGAPCSGPGS